MTVDVQEVVQAELDAMVTADAQLGIQVAVYQHGQLVVDAWSGHTEPTRSAPVRSDTLFPIFSCSKGLMYTTVHLLAEHGELDYDAQVSDYWPEFGQNGKGEATIRQVLVHTSGVQDITHDFHLDDWDGTCARLAESEAMWIPGSETAYRGLSSGFVLGEVASRVYGKPFGQIVTELICEPLGITDLFFGVPASVKDRIAVLANDESVLTGPASSPDTRIMAELFNTPSIQASAVPAGGAITSARSLARHYASLIGDGVDSASTPASADHSGNDAGNRCVRSNAQGAGPQGFGLSTGRQRDCNGRTVEFIRPQRVRRFVRVCRSGLRFEFRAHEESTGCHDASRGAGLGRPGEYGTRSFVHPERLTAPDRVVTKIIDKRRVSLCTFTFRWTWKASQELRRSTR